MGEPEFTGTPVASLRPTSSYSITLQAVYLPTRKEAVLGTEQQFGPYLVSRNWIVMPNRNSYLRFFISEPHATRRAAEPLNRNLRTVSSFQLNGLCGNVG